MKKMKEIPIKTEFIKLNQFLKWCGAAESGAEANHLILEGKVKVNGEVEQRRGRKLYPGDIIEVSEYERFLVSREGCADIAIKGVKP